MNPHLKLLEETVNIVGEERWIEISHEVPFGFHEIKEPDRINLSINEFLDEIPDIETYRTCVFHILLGCGIDQRVLIRAIDRATRLFDRVFVLEHDRNSTDWDSEEIRLEHFIGNCTSGEEFLGWCKDYRWKQKQTIYVNGFSDGKRNMIIELEGKNPEYTLPFPEIKQDEIWGQQPGQEASYKDLRDVYLGNADDVSLLKDISTRINKYKRSLSSESKLYVSCGGFFSLNLINSVVDADIKDITFYDFNPYTTKFAESVIKIIKSSENIEDFLENYLMLKIGKSGRICPTCGAGGNDEFVFLPTSHEERENLYKKNLEYYNEEVVDLFKLILNSPYDSEKLYIYGLMHIGGAEEGELQLKYGGPKYEHNNAIEVGYGWLESDQSFNCVKEFLSNSDLHFLCSDLDKLVLGKNDLLFTSNVLEFNAKTTFDYNCKVVEGNRSPDHFKGRVIHSK